MPLAPPPYMFSMEVCATICYHNAACVNTSEARLLYKNKRANSAVGFEFAFVASWAPRVDCKTDWGYVC